MKKEFHRKITGFIAYFGRNGLKSVLSHSIQLIGIGVVLAAAQSDSSFDLIYMLLGMLTFTAGILHSRLVEIYSELKTGPELEEKIGEEYAFLWYFAIGGSIILAWTSFWIGVIL